MKPTESSHLAVSKLNQKLLERLKKSAAKFGFTREAFILAGESAAEFQRHTLVPILGPFPTAVDEAEVYADSGQGWPDWVAELVPEGSKWERLYWPDGSITIRLMNPQAVVLAAKYSSNQ